MKDCENLTNHENHREHIMNLKAFQCLLQSIIEYCNDLKKLEFDSNQVSKLSDYLDKYLDKISKLLVFSIDENIKINTKLFLDISKFG